MDSKHLEWSQAIVSDYFDPVPQHSSTLNRQVTCSNHLALSSFDSRFLEVVLAYNFGLSSPSFFFLFSKFVFSSCLTARLSNPSLILTPSLCHCLLLRKRCHCRRPYCQAMVHYWTSNRTINMRWEINLLLSVTYMIIRVYLTLYLLIDILGRWLLKSWIMLIYVLNVCCVGLTLIILIGMIHIVFHVSFSDCNILHLIDDSKLFDRVAQILDDLSFLFIEDG